MNQDKGKINQNGPAVTGHDSSITTRELDDYNRWPVACSISSIIATSPPEWSTRIGIYGGWGDGKSTLLNFIATQQIEQNNIVIRYNPWGISNNEDILNDFSSILKKELAKNKINIGRFNSFIFNLKRLIRWLSGFLGKLGGISEKVYIPPYILETTAERLNRYFSFRSSDIESLCEQIGSRRVIVLIDDLDRADPKIIPILLLALKELLDLPKFIFVLAFDPEIITNALAEYNKAWSSSSESFLVKIIDFPYELPPPQNDQIKKLAYRQFEHICPFVPRTQLDNVIDILPANPRKLKLFARLIGSLSQEVRRHEEEELDWTTILTFYLMKIENPNFTNDLKQELIKETESINSRWDLFSINIAESEKNFTKFLEEQHKLLSDQAKNRLKLIYTTWRSNCSFQEYTRLKYQLLFSELPHNITWCEFKNFFEEWCKSKNYHIVKKFIEDRSKNQNSSPNQVMSEFVETIIEYYGTILEQACSVYDIEEHAHLISKANNILFLIEELFLNELCSLPDIYTYFSIKNWQRFLKICNSWIQFRANPGELELRNREKKLLTKLLEISPEPLQYYNVLSPWSSENFLTNPEADDLRKDLLSHLIETLTDKMMELTLSTFYKPNGIKSVLSIIEQEGLYYILSAPNSRLYKEPYKSKLLETLSKAKDNQIISINCFDYFEMMLSALNNGGRFCNKEKRQEFLKAHNDLVLQLWGSFVTRRLQYRFTTYVKKCRATLIQNGVSEKDLPLPGWVP